MIKYLRMNQFKAGKLQLSGYKLKSQHPGVCHTCCIRVSNWAGFKI